MVTSRTGRKTLRKDMPDGSSTVRRKHMSSMHLEAGRGWEAEADPALRACLEPHRRETARHGHGSEAAEVLPPRPVVQQSVPHEGDEIVELVVRQNDRCREDRVDPLEDRLD